jgi:arsenate reductase
MTYPESLPMLHPFKNNREFTMSVTIYHNPRCSKSRKTLEILNAQNVDLEIIEYLKSPPDAETLKQILSYLNIPARGQA